MSKKKRAWDIPANLTQSEAKKNIQKVSPEAKPPEELKEPKLTKKPKSPEKSKKSSPRIDESDVKILKVSSRHHRAVKLMALMQDTMMIDFVEAMIEAEAAKKGVKV